MQARLAAEMKDPVMRVMIYGVGAYTVASFGYSLVPKSAPKKQESHAPVAQTKIEEIKVPHAEHKVEVDQHATKLTSGEKQQVAPVLQQLATISDRLTRIEKALGI